VVLDGLEWSRPPGRSFPNADEGVNPSVRFHAGSAGPQPIRYQQTVFVESQRDDEPTFEGARCFAATDHPAAGWCRDYCAGLAAVT
jgi:hypothetical protein